MGALGGTAFAQSAPVIPSPPERVPPLSPSLPTVPERRAGPAALAPIPFVYRQIDRERINTNSNPGRTNATRGTVVEQRTGFWEPPLGGNPM